MYLSYVLADIGTTYRNGFCPLLLVLVGWASLVYRIPREERVLSQHAEWPAYVVLVRYRFSPVFGKSAARLRLRLPYRTISLLPTATEDRLSTGGNLPDRNDNTLFLRFV